MKTIIKYLDWLGQSVLMVMGFGILILGLRESGWPYGVLWVQFFLGVWQLASGLLGILLGFPGQRARMWYFFSALVWCGILYARSVLFKDIGNEWMLLSLVIIPWVFAIFYYYITCMTVFRKEVSRGFLPHINF